ncbi:MAG TPA: serine/threonine-protein kinase, partial [Planctomycetota bacterium]|nr:serine/threonine-protein kinase [Planctomycetota bacterium]
MGCSRCGASPSESDWAEPAGLCVDCVLGVAAEQEPPDLPDLEILGTIGRGGMGVVYRARQAVLGRIVAVKVLAGTSGAEFEERFAREARLLSQIDHPGIVTLHDFGLHEGVPYFVMEHVDGTSLREFLRQRPPVQRALELAEEVLAILAFAHARGIVHRDIKPENVLVDSSGRVKVTDFGLAKFAPEGEERLTRTGVVMGTPAYMAPEQLERPGEVDARADLYAVGAMLYEMLTGELPVGRFRRPGVSRAVDAAVLRLLAHRPEDRPATAELAAADLRRARRRRPGRGWPVTVIVASVAIVLLVLYVGRGGKPPQWV